MGGSSAGKFATILGGPVGFGGGGAWRAFIECPGGIDGIGGSSALMSTAAILGGPVGVDGGAWRAFIECPGGMGLGSSAAVGSAKVIVLRAYISFRNGVMVGCGGRT
jgi:hypothetical protein